MNAALRGLSNESQPPEGPARPLACLGTAEAERKMQRGEEAGTAMVKGRRPDQQQAVGAATVPLVGEPTASKT